MIKSVKELSELMAMYNELPKDQKEISLLEVKSELMRILNSINVLRLKLSNQIDIIDTDVECDCDKPDCPICSGEECESELTEIYSDLYDSVEKEDFCRAVLLLVNLTKDVKPVQKVVEPQKSENPEKKKFRRVVSR